VSPGEDGVVVLTLHNMSDYTFNLSPCVGALADDPGVTDIYGSTRGYNPWPKYFGIGANQSLDFQAHFHLDSSIAPGTVIHFMAWVDLQNAGCVNGQEIFLTLTVAP